MTSNIWTPTEVVAVVGALTTLIGTMVGGIITVVKAIKGNREVSNNAIDSMRESVPGHLVTSLVANGVASAIANNSAPTIDQTSSSDPEEASQ